MQPASTRATQADQSDCPGPPRVFYGVYSYRPTLASAQASASASAAQHRVGFFGCGCAGGYCGAQRQQQGRYTGYGNAWTRCRRRLRRQERWGTAAAELAALWRGAVPGAPISRRTLRSMRAFVRIAHTGRMRYVAHRGWPAVDSRGTWGRSAVPSSGVGVGVGVAPHLRPSASR